jgi:hypothetical protein
MQKIIRDLIEMSGYHSGETDFDPAYARAVTDIADFATNFEDHIMAPLVHVAQDLSQCAMLRVTGLSDRVDTAGLTREQIRDQEYEASSVRARSATDGIFAMLNARVGGTLGADWVDVPNIAVSNQGSGAAYLTESGSPLTEAQRQRNRRVYLRFTQFVP